MAEVDWVLSRVTEWAVCSRSLGLVWVALAWLEGELKFVLQDVPMNLVLVCTAEVELM